MLFYGRSILSKFTECLADIAKLLNEVCCRKTVFFWPESNKERGDVDLLLSSESRILPSSSTLFGGDFLRIKVSICIGGLENYGVNFKILSLFYSFTPI